MKMTPLKSPFLASLVACFAVTFGLVAPLRAEETHKLVATTAAKAPVGQPTTLAVTLEGRNGWHINAEAPIAMKLQPVEGLTVAKRQFGRADLAESTATRARFDVQATPAGSGVKTINAEASFVMCQETECKPVRETLTLTVEPENAKDGLKPNVKPSKRKRPSKG